MTLNVHISHICLTDLVKYTFMGRLNLQIRHKYYVGMECACTVLKQNGNKELTE